MRVDVNALLGAYPWRRVPGTSPEALRAAMDRAGIDEAWVSHLPSFFWRSPGEGNAWLYEATGRDQRLKPIAAASPMASSHPRSEEHTSELQSRPHLVCRLLLEKKKKQDTNRRTSVCLARVY